MEELHPELRAIIKRPMDMDKKEDRKQLLADQIQRITARGESTGIEGNMPKGSSRAYLKHRDMHDIIVDGNPTKIPIGTKFAIKANLDKFHNHREHDGLSLGALQNEAEGGDHLINNTYRILRKDGSNYKTNNERGIFPPLIDHDHRNHQWSQVGHAENIKAEKFNELTKTDGFPGGISHREFSDVLMRNYKRQNNRYFDQAPSIESNLDIIERHPLVQKFLDYHDNTGHTPIDLEQIQNLGLWKQPDGTKHIVARDHGFTNVVAEAYRNAMNKNRKEQW